MMADGVSLESLFSRSNEVRLCQGEKMRDGLGGSDGQRGHLGRPRAARRGEGCRRDDSVVTTPTFSPRRRRGGQTDHSRLAAVDTMSASA